MDKRQILREKSLYKKKEKEWNLLDEIQFAFIENKLSTTECFITGIKLRPLVRRNLEYLGRTVEVYSLRGGKKLWYQISK